MAHIGRASPRVRRELGEGHMDASTATATVLHVREAPDIAYYSHELACLVFARRFAKAAGKGQELSLFGSTILRP